MFKPDQVTFDSKEAASYLSVSEPFLRTSRSTGMLGDNKAPVYRKIGRKVIYLKSDLDFWLSNLPTFENTQSAG